MRYTSTRGIPQDAAFEHVVMQGLAPDGGLFVPRGTLPKVDDSTLQRWRSLSFVDLSLEVISLFISNDEIPRADLADICERTFASGGEFRDPKVVPLHTVSEKEAQILELFHGPTFAFKDVALQFLGNLFEYFLKKTPGRRLTVLGATSGDTGSAAIYGLKGKANIDVFILHPKGRMSKVQELQMTTVADRNVHNVAVEGTFDDCQTIMKTLFADSEFRSKHSLGAVNSINWARILAQIVYYFAAYFQRTTTDPVAFVVPTGNFGDILAGYYAKEMGLPVSRLVVATNKNDILHRFIAKNDYSMRPVVQTVAPSMDIVVSSNFERYLFYLADKDPAVLKSWMEVFKASGKLEADDKTFARLKSDFASASADQEAIETAIQRHYKEYGYLLCPHTATGVHAARKLVEKGAIGSLGNVVCLATAHAAKFGLAVGRAVGVSQDALPMPEQLSQLCGLPTKVQTCKNTVKAVRDLVDTTPRAA